jgi:hypothetical protein
MFVGVSGQFEEVLEEDGLFKGRVRSSPASMSGRTLRALRNFTKAPFDEEPTWRSPAEQQPPWGDEADTMSGVGGGEPMIE